MTFLHDNIKRHHFFILLFFASTGYISSVSAEQNLFSYTGDVMVTDTYFTKGRELLHDGEYKKAIEMFNQVIVLDRGYRKAYASMGMAYLKLGEKETANRYFRMATGNSKGEEGKSHFITNERDTEKSGDWIIHFQKGENYYKNNRVKKAIEEYTLAVQYNKNSYMAYFSMGAAYKKIGNYSLAIDAWEKALQINTEDTLIKKLLTKLKKEQSFVDSMKSFKTAIEKNPSDIQARLSLGMLYLETQKFAKAANQFTRVLQFDKKNRNAYLGLTAVKSASGNLSDAINLLEEYRHVDKKDETVLSQLTMMKEYKYILDNNRFLKKRVGRDLNTEIVFVPAGKFFMGTQDSTIEAGVDEKPENEVFVDSFYIDRYEVTNIQYKDFVKDTGHEVPFHWNTPSNQSHSEMIRFNGQHYPEEADYYPVSYVTWFDAEAYCRWAGKRLPSEAEWEKAARSSDRRKYPWGNEFDQNRANTARSHFKGPTPIGSYPDGVSPYNVYDMAGNVWEWTADWYKGYTGTSLKRDSFGEKFRVVRGGSFLDPPKLHIRTSERHAELPRMKHRSIGFRCAKDVKKKTIVTLRE